MSEVWQKVKGYEDSYLVSNHGRVKSLSSSRVFTGSNSGYARCRIGGRMLRVHRLVAEAFIPNPENKPQVNHLDGDKQNNHVSNLEWCTNAENAIHAYQTGITETVNPPFTKDDVKAIRKLKAEGFGATEISRKLSLNYWNVSKVYNNKTWNQKGKGA